MALSPRRKALERPRRTRPRLPSSGRTGAAEPPPSRTGARGLASSAWVPSALGYLRAAVCMSATATRTPRLSTTDHVDSRPRRRNFKHFVQVGRRTTPRFGSGCAALPDRRRRKWRRSEAARVGAAEQGRRGATTRVMPLADLSRQTCRHWRLHQENLQKRAPRRQRTGAEGATPNMARERDSSTTVGEAGMEEATGSRTTSALKRQCKESP